MKTSNMTYNIYPCSTSSGTAIANPLKQRKIFIPDTDPIFVKVTGAAHVRAAESGERASKEK